MSLPTSYPVCRLVDRTRPSGRTRQDDQKPAVRHAANSFFGSTASHELAGMNWGIHQPIPRDISPDRRDTRNWEQVDRQQGRPFAHIDVATIGFKPQYVGRNDVFPTMIFEIPAIEAPVRR